MKRLRRWLFNFAAGVSLMISIALCGIWIRSYWIEYQVSGGYVRGSRQISITVIFGRGGIGAQIFNFLEIHRPGDLDSLVFPIQHSQKTRPEYPDVALFARKAAVLGFYIYHDIGHTPRQDTGLFVIVPDWSLVGLTAILPAIWYIRFRRHRLRMSNNLCPVCGYDLRATPERCPECGTISGSVEKGAAT